MEGFVSKSLREQLVEFLESRVTDSKKEFLRVKNSKAHVREGRLIKSTLDLNERLLKQTKEEIYPKADLIPGID